MLLSQQAGTGILELNEETMELINAKHPRGTDKHNDTLLHHPIQEINPVIYQV